MLEKEYSSEIFRQRAYKIADQLADFLLSSYSNFRKVIRITRPKEEYSFWKNYQVKSLESFNKDLIARSITIHHPHYMGHQVSATLPDLALLGLTSDLLNNGMGIYEMGAAATAMEKWVIEQYAEVIGYDDNSSGFLTSGGTLANLTALLGAKAKAISRFPNQTKWIILVSEQAHFCIERAGVTMGLPLDSIVKIKTSENFQIDIHDLTSQYNSYKEKGFETIAVVGCACSTATGTYDDLEKLSEFCLENKLWLHIDGAHGGSALFSKKLGDRLMNGIQHANSVIIDAHKMMLTPALATAVVFKNGDDSFNTFKHRAEYLFDQSKKDYDNLAKRTYETTKYMMSVKIYYLLKHYGHEFIGNYIEHQHDLAQKMYDYINSTKDFQAAHRPMSNILCFRYIADGFDNRALNHLNRSIREKILEDGEFYIVSTELKDSFYLRVSIMNPLTEWSHLKSLLDNIESIALLLIKKKD